MGRLDLLLDGRYFCRFCNEMLFNVNEIKQGAHSSEERCKRAKENSLEAVQRRFLNEVKDDPTD